MSIGDDLLAAAKAAPTPPGPKRPTLDERIAQAQARTDQLIRQRAARERKADAHRKIVIGGTVMAAMAEDDELRQRIGALLDERVKAPRDREAVAPWLRSRDG